MHYEIFFKQSMINKYDNDVNSYIVLVDVYEYVIDKDGE